MKNNQVLFFLSFFLLFFVGNLFLPHNALADHVCAGSGSYNYQSYSCSGIWGCMLNSATWTAYCNGTPPLCSHLGPQVYAPYCSATWDGSQYNCYIMPGALGWDGTGCYTICNGCTGGCGNGQACDYGSCSCYNLYCNSNAVCNACGGGNEPANTCGTTAGRQSCTNTGYNGGYSPYCIRNGFTQGCTYTYRNCSNNYACVNGNTCVTNLHAHVYKDYNHDGQENNGDSGFGGVGVNDGGGNTINTDGNGNVTFTGKTTGNYTITANTPTQWKPSTADPVNAQLNNGNGDLTVNFGMTPLFSVSGKVFYDLNEDGKLDNGEVGIQKGTLTINGSAITINADGTYSDTNLLSGTYTATYTPAIGYQTIYPTTSYSVTVGTPGQNPACNSGNYNDDSCDGWGNIVNLNIAVTPLHIINGTVYKDINENFYFDGPDIPYTNGGTVTLVGPIGSPTQTQTTTTTSLSVINGTYSFPNLFSGQYTASYAPPMNYHTTYPVPPQFTVVVGGPIGTGSPQPCNVNNYHDASCNATGDINGLDFGISNANEWTQGFCTDVRFDNGVTDLIPSTANCAGTSSPYVSITNANNAAECTDPGVVFSGGTDPNFGEGGANVNNWQIGNSTYKESFVPRTQGVIASSYSAMTANISRTGAATYNLASYCSLTNCTLPGNLPDGIFEATGNVSLNAYTFPVSTPTQNHGFIFHINGSLTINGNIIAPAGTVDIFAVTGNITVIPTVGETSATSTIGDVEGIFTTDQSFIVQSAYAAGQHCDIATGNPKDLRLNIEGVVITNAGNTGGSFQVQRDLCNQNRSCPTLIVNQRADMLLFLPSIARNTNSLFQEVAP